MFVPRLLYTFLEGVRDQFLTDANYTFDDVEDDIQRYVQSKGGSTKVTGAGATSNNIIIEGYSYYQGNLKQHRITIHIGLESYFFRGVARTGAPFFNIRKQHRIVRRYGLLQNQPMFLNISQYL